MLWFLEPVVRRLAQLLYGRGVGSTFGRIEGLRIHDLRHSFASFLLNGGRSLYGVQQILGHSDPKVTMRYAHFSIKALQEAANAASEIVKQQKAA